MRSTGPYITEEVGNMAKISKTYRLSEEAVDAIGERDRSMYPTAAGFIEHKILGEREGAGQNKKLEDMQKDLAQVRESIGELKLMLLAAENASARKEKNTGGSGMAYPLPDMD